jgi:hypothetical protein
LAIQIIDSNNAIKQVTLSVTVLPKLQILRLRLAGGQVGHSYKTNVRVTGGKGPVWTMSSGKLPTGLKLSSANGVISGVPKRAGSFRFSVSVKDSLGATVSIRYVLLIRK